MKRRDVAAFIDWQSQLINSRAIGGRIPLRIAVDAAVFVTDVIDRALQNMGAGVAYFVDVKVYHGWHRGLTPTANFLALREAVRDRLVPTRRGVASFNWQQPFGNVLTNCSPHRLHPKLQIHLPNTMRQDISHGGDREKMVDTALTCDVLVDARSSPDNLRLILAEDDDLVPAAFTADAWGKPRGGKTIIIRKREASEFLNMTGVYRKMEIDNAD